MLAQQKIERVGVLSDEQKKWKILILKSFLNEMR